MSKMKLNNYGKIAFNTVMITQGNSPNVNIRLAKPICYDLYGNKEAVLHASLLKLDEVTPFKYKDIRFEIPYFTDDGSTGQNAWYSIGKYTTYDRRIYQIKNSSLWTNSNIVSNGLGYKPILVLSTDTQDLLNADQYTLDLDKIIECNNTDAQSYSNPTLPINTSIRYSVIYNEEFDELDPMNCTTGKYKGLRITQNINNVTSSDVTINSLYLISQSAPNAADGLYSEDRRGNGSYSFCIKKGHQDSNITVNTSSGTSSLLPFYIKVGTYAAPFTFDRSILLGVCKLDEPIIIAAGDSRNIVVDILYDIVPTN